MSSLDEISRAIGALQAQSRILLAAQERHADETKEIRQELQSLGADMKVVKSDVAAFRPAAKKVEKWEQRAVGMGAAGGFFGSWAIAWFKSKGWI